MKRGRAIRRWVLVPVIVAGLVFAAWQFWPQTSPQSNENSPEAEVAETLEPAQPDVGLQQLAESIATAKGDYAIAVVEPNGRRASTNGDKQYTAASTYKLYIAYGVFQRIDSGDLQWSDQVFGGRNADECFELMIVQSDNDCTYAFGDLVGWQAVDGMMEQLGLLDTQVKYHDNITTADDLAIFLLKLQEGDLLNAVDSEKLLNAMKRQVYRKGIPAGTGVEVADKPGFLDDLLHDAGIVYGLNGPYVLVIMSDNSTWGQLADAANQIHTYLQQ